MTKPHLLLSSLVIGGSLLGACAIDDEPSDLEYGTAQSSLLSYTRTTVAPSATVGYDAYSDPGHPIGTAPDANPAVNVVYVPQWDGQIHFIKLLVFLHGNGGAPAGYDDIMSTAAANGYNVVGLSYPQITNQPCDGADAASCMGELQYERAFGVDMGSASDISTHPQDAVVSRLRALLLYLRDTRPASEGWGNFLTGTINPQPKWSVITLGGHSMGANTSAFLAHFFAVPRVVMFSGVVDAPDTLPLQSADWLVPGTTPDATSPDLYYGLVHTNDLNSAQFAVPRKSKILNNWNTIGLPGSPTSVDGTATPPYGNSHRLKTSVCLDIDLTDGVACAAQTQAQKESAAHNKIASDGPENDQYLAAWTYMLTN